MTSGIRNISSRRFGVGMRIFLVGLNLLAAVLGLVYVLSPQAARLGTVFGYLLITAVMVTSTASAFPVFRCRRSLAYLGFVAVGFFNLPFLLIGRASFMKVDMFSAAVYAVVFGALALGAAAGLPGPSAGRDSFRPRPWTAGVGLAAGITALAVTIRFLAGSQPRMGGVIVPQCLPYWSLSFAATGSLAARAGRTLNRSRPLAPLFALPAMVAAVLGMLPIVQTIGVTREADRDFLTSFGVRPSEVRGPLMRDARFSPGPMFLGSPPGDSLIALDIPYLTESTKDGRTYIFRYDLWSPPGRGPHPVLIRIHGGGWVSGDKGAGNMNNVNRYFSARGFLVFDLQYGLSETGTFEPRAPTPEGMAGPFGIGDMVRQISAFSSFLADRADEMDADLGRVFTSGASAGGHLALAVSLARTSGYVREYPGMGMDPRITVRGVIPFYPGIGYAAGMGIPVEPVLDGLEPLLGPDNPPALFYQGSLDGMVDARRIRRFVRAYNETGGGRAVLVEFPSAGHASDFLFWNAYSQVFIYYMERFLALKFQVKEAKHLQLRVHQAPVPVLVPSGACLGGAECSGAGNLRFGNPVAGRRTLRSGVRGTLHRKPGRTPCSGTA